jgi:small redox-active disulfide protein 2
MEVTVDIKILGTGCPKCKQLYEQTEKAVQGLGIPATLTKVEKLNEIMAFKVFMTPALVIDGEVKVAGRVPSSAELTTWITTAAMNQEAL